MRRVVVVPAAGIALSMAACAATATTTVAVNPSGAGAVVVHGNSEEATSVPACRWPLSVRGPASRSQIGLVGCYLRAVARRSLDELGPLVITPSGTPVTLSRAELGHADDVRSGTATATVTPNRSDPFNASVVIRFADGATQVLDMDALNPTVPASRSWRLDLGTTPPDPSDPPGMQDPS